MPKSWKHMPRTGHALLENQATQPRRIHPVFANPNVVTEGWYPVLASSKLKRGQATSITVLFQRLAIFRKDNGLVSAIDAFCPHLGADLGNGIVRDNKIQCRLHGWTFEERGGYAWASKSSCKIKAYPTEEALGTIWVYAGDLPSHSIPRPPGLENAVGISGFRLMSARLFTHHHVLALGGIDIEHFASIHKLHAEFAVESHAVSPGVRDWQVNMQTKNKGLRAKLLRKLVGDTFTYRLRIVGGNLFCITYGYDQEAKLFGIQIPPLHVMWGCTPTKDQVSDAQVYVVTPKRCGLLGRGKSWIQRLLTIALLVMLRDEDVAAFPNFRINTINTKHLHPILRNFIAYIDTLPVSNWTNQNPPKDKKRDYHGIDPTPRPNRMVSGASATLDSAHTRSHSSEC